MACSSASALSASSAHATEAVGWAAATMAGFSPASSSASAALSPRRRPGCGPRSSPSGVMALLCRGPTKLVQRPSAEPTARWWYGRTAAGMSNPTGPDQGKESADRPAGDISTPGDESPAQDSAPTEAAPIVEEHPTEVMAVEDTGAIDP